MPLCFPKFSGSFAKREEKKKDLTYSKYVSWWFMVSFRLVGNFIYFELKPVAGDIFVREGGCFESPNRNHVHKKNVSSYGFCQTLMRSCLYLSRAARHTDISTHSRYVYGLTFLLEEAEQWPLAIFNETSERLRYFKAKRDVFLLGVLWRLNQTMSRALPQDEKLTISTKRNIKLQPRGPSWRAFWCAPIVSNRRTRLERFSD